MTKVRTTIRPDEELDVDDAEHLDLSRAGLPLDEDAPSSSGAPSGSRPASKNEEKEEK